MLILEDERLQPEPGDKEYRCTLPELYPMGDGKTDPWERQGFYLYAKDEEGARELMRRRFPTAKKIDVQEFTPRKGVKACKAATA